MSEPKKYPYVQIRKGSFTQTHYPYLLRLWVGEDDAYYDIRFAWSIRSARKVAKGMLAAYNQRLIDEQFSEEVRL